MSNTIKELIERQSVRIFEDKQISKEDKQAILDAAVNGPSANNKQTYSIIDVTDQSKIDKLAELCGNQPFISKAKMVLVFCADNQKWMDVYNDLDLNPRHPEVGDLMVSIVDATIAAQNAVTAAWSLGIGSCYIGYIVDKFDDINPLFNIPQYTYPCCMVVFGYPDKEHLPAQKRKRFDNKYIIFENEYKRFNSEELKDMMLERTLPREYKDWVSDYIGKKHNSDSTKARMVSINKYIERYTKD